MMQTVTEQLVEALKTCLGELTNVDASLDERHEAALGGLLALDRARAEPCTDACLHHKDDDLPDCPCYEAGRVERRLGERSKK